MEKLPTAIASPVGSSTTSNALGGLDQHARRCSSAAARDDMRRHAQSGQKSHGYELRTEWHARCMLPSVCAARHGARACWAGIPSLRRAASGRDTVGFAQIFGSVHSRLWLLQLSRPLCGPADRPGRCPPVPATTSEAELRTAEAIGIFISVRVVHPWDLELLKCFHSHIWRMGMENHDHALF